MRKYIYFLYRISILYVVFRSLLRASHPHRRPCPRSRRRFFPPPHPAPASLSIGGIKKRKEKKVFVMCWFPNIVLLVVCIERFLFIYSLLFFSFFV